MKDQIINEVINNKIPPYDKSFCHPRDKYREFYTSDQLDTSKKYVKVSRYCNLTNEFVQGYQEETEWDTETW